MKVGFLVINYNDYETTKKIILNIKNYKIIDKIVVVDNNSTDNSYIELKKIKIKNLEIIKNDTNKGYGAGINFGSKYLEKILGDCYVIISNPDIIIYQENDIKELINTFDVDTAIVAPIIKEHSGLNRGWKILTPFQDCLMNLIYMHKFFRKYILFYPIEFYEKEIVNVDTVSGCFFIIKNKILKELNYFDENVFLYYEENIIGKKIKDKNLKIKLNNTVEVFHNHSITIDKSINHINKYKILKRSQMYFHKIYNKANMFELLLLFITNKVTLFCLYVIHFFKNIKKN